MERIEVNCVTGEQKVIQLTAEEIVAIPQPRPITYQELRAYAYPPIGDQLDAIWKGGDAQADMLKQVMAVKNKYPKG